MTPFDRLGSFVIISAFLVAHGAAETGQPPKVDFGYAFAYPHRITVALPDSGNKTLVDCSPDGAILGWAVDDLAHLPDASFKAPVTQWHLNLTATVDGRPLAGWKWHRLNGWEPTPEGEATDVQVAAKMTIAGTSRAAVARIRFTNQDLAKPHEVVFRADVPGHWTGLNPAFVDATGRAAELDCLLAGWRDRADRVLAVAVGGRTVSLTANAIGASMELQPGESGELTIVRPYVCWESMLPEARSRDWRREVEQASAIWQALIGRAARIELPDEGVRNAYYAGLADIFVMREPAPNGYITTVPGTEMYRSVNPIEAAIASVGLTQAGLTSEALDGYRLSFDQQNFDGCWADSPGWGHDCWFCSGFKSWFAMEYYRDTGDRDFLKAILPRMLASSRWQARARARMRRGSPDSDNYGLLPPGMGDAGLKNGDSLYGVFLPHNIWAVYADQLTAEAAAEVGSPDEISEAQAIADRGKVDLVRALRRGAITEEGHQWIPGVAHLTSGSRWGAVNAAYPTGILPLNDPLIDGTLWKLQAHMSEGGLPLHTGWMEDGTWVAISLDNLAETLLARGDSDGFDHFLYAVLNHGTSLYSWCEERGSERGTTKTMGDRQHLWTPASVVRGIRDGLIWDEPGLLDLARGADRSWLIRGPVGGRQLQSRFGPVAYLVRADLGSGKVEGWVQLNPQRLPKTLRVHVRLPAGRAFRLAGPSGGIWHAEGEFIEWSNPAAKVAFSGAIH